MGGARRSQRACPVALGLPGSTCSLSENHQWEESFISLSLSDKSRYKLTQGLCDESLSEFIPRPWSGDHQVFVARCAELGSYVGEESRRLWAFSEGGSCPYAGLRAASPMKRLDMSITGESKDSQTSPV